MFIRWKLLISIDHFIDNSLDRLISRKKSFSTFQNLEDFKGELELYQEHNQKRKKIKKHQKKCVQVEITRLFYAKFIVKKEIYRMQNIHNV